MKFSLDEFDFISLANLNIHIQYTFEYTYSNFWELVEKIPVFKENS